MDVISNRCINCGLLLQHRLQIRYNLGQASEDMLSIIERWIAPIEPSPLHILCKECFLIVRAKADTNDFQRSYGHRLICLGCGKSVLNQRRYHRHQDGSAILALILSDLPPLEFAEMNIVCEACQRRASRRMNIDNQRYMQDRLPENNIAMHNVEIQVLPPPPPPMPLVNFANVAQNIVQPTLRLPNFKRVAATTRRCIFNNCHNANNFHLVPLFIKKKLLSDTNIYIPRNTRVCDEHRYSHLWNDLQMQTLYNDFTNHQVEDIIYMSRQTSAMFDFENIDAIDDRVCHWYLGVNVIQFMQILSETTTLSAGLKNPKTALAAYLAKLRTGDSDERLSLLFNLSRTTFEKYVKFTRRCLATDYVPLHVGLNHISVQEVAERNLIIPNSLFVTHRTETDEQPAVIICDGTYDYTQKSSNYKHQKLTYSLHKYRNLVKPFLCVCSDGYILDIKGPYQATSSDSKIMSHLFRDETSEFNTYFRKGDVFILDRGFRDCIPLLESRGFKAHMPQSVLPGQFQLTTFQANQSRCVTLVRWVVEVVNGRFKRDFKLLRQDYCNRSVENVKNDFLISGAIINNFHKLLTNRSDAHEIVSRALSRLHLPNYLADYVGVNNLNRQRASFIRIDGNLPHLDNFPKLSMAQLELIALGTYQIKQCRSYYGEHIKENGVFEIEVSSEIEITNTVNLNGNLIRGKIKSRHTSRKTYFTYILYNSFSEYTENSIIGYCCNCKAGNRTVGCCSHTMVIIWFLSWARYDQNHLQPTAPYLNNLFEDDLSE